MPAHDGQPPAADPATVIDWLEQRLGPVQAAQVAEQAQRGEPAVVATVEWWQRFTAAAALSEPVPTELAATLRAMTLVTVADPVAPGEARSPASRLVQRLVGSVRASVSFDSLSSPSLSMARAGGDATRQLVLSAPGVDVAVDLDQPQGGTAARAGVQVLPEDDTADPGGVRVQVWGSGGLLRDESADEAGGLDLGELPREVVVLEVGAGEGWPAVYAEIDLRRST